MIKGKLLLLKVFFVLASSNIIAQKPDLKSYLVLTVEDSFSKGFEGVRKYYWIVEVDSVKSSNSIFFPLILTGFSKDNFENCCKGVDIDPFTYTRSDSVFDMGIEYFKGSEHLQNLIYLNRKKIQEITKEWVSTKGKEIIKIYITPINGRFCSSGFAKTGQWRTGYNSNVLIPYSSFELNLQFWKSSKFSILSSQDFSSLKFGIIK